LSVLLSLTPHAVITLKCIMGSYSLWLCIQSIITTIIRHFNLDETYELLDLRFKSYDAIESVAHYLVEHGWQRDLPVFAPVNLPAEASSLVDGGLEPTLDWPKLAAAGATTRPTTAMAGLVSGSAGTAYSKAWQSRPLG